MLVDTIVKFLTTIFSDLVKFFGGVWVGKKREQLKQAEEEIVELKEKIETNNEVINIIKEDDVPNPLQAMREQAKKSSKKDN